MPTLATAVQDAAARRLATLGLRGIPVHGLRRGELWSDVAAALNAVGLAVHILPVLTRGLNGNIPGPYVENGQFVVRVVEDPLLNQTDLTRWDVMETCIATLEGWDPGISEVQPCQVNSDVSEAIVQMGLGESGQYLLQLECTFRVSGPVMATALGDTLGAAVIADVDTPVLKRGSIVLTEAATDVEITYASAYPVVPTALMAEVLVPSGGDIITCSVPTISRTQYGFTATFSAPIPALPAGYRLQWLTQL